VLSLAQVAAAGRHLLTFVSGGVSGAAAVLATLHVVSAGDVATIANSLTQISNGVAEIVAGLAPLVAIASGAWAAWTASHTSQIAAVNAVPGIKVVKESGPGAVVTGAPATKG
jgi:hypothetical protein